MRTSGIPHKGSRRSIATLVIIAILCAVLNLEWVPP